VLLPPKEGETDGSPAAYQIPTLPKTAVTWGSVRAFPLVSSTPMNGLSKMTLAPFKIWCAPRRHGSAAGL